jgi:hypothetical protein
MVNAITVHITVDHDVIRSWARARGARPTLSEGMSRPSPLFLDIGPPDAGHVEVNWSDFFEEFERDNVAFYYRDTDPAGAHDDLHGFISRAAVPELTMLAKSTIVEQMV